MRQSCVPTRLRIRAVCWSLHVTGRHTGRTSSEGTERHGPDRTPEEPHRKTVYARTDMQDQCCVTSTDHRGSVPTCPCHDTDGTPFEGMENTESTSQGAARLRTQDEHEAVTVTPIHASKEVERITTAPIKRCAPERRTGGGWGSVLVQPNPERNTTREDVDTFTTRNAHEGHVG